MAFERVLARTERVAVCVSRFAACPTGFEFDVVTMTADDQDELDPLMFRRYQRMPRGATDEIPPELLRFGVQFSDGSPATNIDGFHDHREPPAGRAEVIFSDAHLPEPPDERKGPP